MMTKLSRFELCGSVLLSRSDKPPTLWSRRTKVVRVATHAFCRSDTMPTVHTTIAVTAQIKMKKHHDSRYEAEQIQVCR